MNHRTVRWSIQLSILLAASSIQIAHGELFFRQINTKLQARVGVPVAIGSKGQPTVTVPARPESVTVPVATPDQQAKLQAQIDQAVQTFKEERDKYEFIAVVFVLVSVTLALGASVFGFMRRPLAAGVLSLLVAASTGTGKVIPITDRANYYRTLYGQALTLQLDTNLATQVTTADYNDRISRLKTILIYASNLPSVGEVTPLTDGLLKEINEKPEAKSTMP